MQWKLENNVLDKKTCPRKFIDRKKEDGDTFKIYLRKNRIENKKLPTFQGQ